MGHRERLLEAMADALREAGFVGATVAEVVRRARTSRRTFYEHFADREACFLALFDAYSDLLLETVEEAAAVPGPWEERVDRTLGAYLGAVAADPHLARILLQEIPALGHAGAERLWEVNRRWARQVARLVEEGGAGERHLAPDAAIVLTGGLRDLVLFTLQEGRDPRELGAVGSDLIRRLTAPAGHDPVS